MADKRGFWVAVLGALLCATGFIVVQFVRAYRQEFGRMDTASVVAAAMVVAVIVLMFMFCGASALVAGWGRRSDHLKSMRTWDVLAPALRTDRLSDDLRRLGRPSGLPWGLTLAANSEGVGLWAGRSTFSCELWLPWQNVVELDQGVAKNGLESWRAVGVVVLWADQIVRFDVPITGGFPFGARIATEEAVNDLLHRLRELRAVPAA
ncbi:hypothetical protein [Herbiconiux liangxiaofengii]|uniref:hypothetical protein n=1 Tax=Herbiconiux liangxiaofengii TaxID=3342795 RepID=UPI0035BB466D